MTVLFAVIALVFGALTLAGVANADPGNGDGNDKTPPGQSETFVPPGQDEGSVPPGQVDRPNTDKKIWICHADTNNGNGQPNLGVNGTGGESGVGFNLIYISVNAEYNAHVGPHPADHAASAVEIAQGYCGASTPTVQEHRCPVGTTNVDTEMTHAYNAQDPADVLFCTPATVPSDSPSNPAQVTAAESATLVPAEVPTATEAETVTAPAPAKVPVATKAQPAAVPAGGGSTAPQTPVTLYALLALGVMAMTASAAKLAARRI